MSLSIGLIGCGGIGLLRAQALLQSKDFKLIAVSDIDAERALAAAAGHENCEVYSDWRELAQRKDLDAVIVSTPPSLHAEMCISALKSGKHVLCEKPLARSPEECMGILDAADKNGKFIATGFNYRFYPSVLKARELFESGIIGELDHIRSYAGYTAADHNHEWLHDVDVMGGGALRDNGIHLIDLTSYFLGGISEVKGFGSNWVWDFEGCEDNGFLLARSPAGKIATLQASWTEWRGYKFGLEIYGTRGCIRVSCFPMLVQAAWSEEFGGKPQHKNYYFPMVHLMEHLRSYRWVVVQSFIQEFEAFSRSIYGEATPLATGYDGLVAVETAYAATHLGSSVKLASGRDPEDTRPRPHSVAPKSLSVVVVPLVNQEYLARCLQALSKQKDVSDFEVVVPYDARLGDVSSLQSKFPSVQFLNAGIQRTYAELRALGVRKSRGEITAITEDHCQPAADWCAQILRAHAKPYAAIGGAVEKQAPDSSLNWAVYFADYLRYANPLPEGPSHSLTDLNVSYKRAALEKISDQWVREFHEPTVHAALQACGEILWLSPRISVNQQRSLTLRHALWDRYAFGRLFASTRVENLPWSRRLMYAGSSILIPALLTVRAANQIRQKRQWIGEFIKALPAILMINTFWAWGEFLGSITGRSEASLTAKKHPGEASQQSRPKAVL